MDNKEIYRELCGNVDIPLFAQAWWLDAVATQGGGKDWDAVIIRNSDNEVVAALPYHYMHKMGFRFILMPQQTQLTYCWCKTPDQFPKLIKEFDKLLKGRTLGAYLQLYLTDKQKGCLETDGWELKCRATYRIEDFSQQEELLKSFSENIRRQIEKAEAKFTIERDMTSGCFYEFHKRCLDQRGLRISYSKELFESLYSAATGNGQCAVFSAVNADGATCAAVMLVWDKETLYYLIPCYDSDYKNSGAMAFLTAEAIKFAAEMSLVFDFEGSSIPSVACRYSQFGSVKKEFYGILKTRWPLTRIFRKFF